MTSFSHPTDDDEHLSPDLLNSLFADDPLDIDAFKLVSEGSHPLPQLIDGAAQMADEPRNPTMMDTVIAVMVSIPNERHFEDADGLVWLADLKGVTVKQMATFSATHKCTPVQAIKTILTERRFSEKELSFDPAKILTVIRTLDEYASDKSLWQALITLHIDAAEVHDVMTFYKLAGYEPAARAVIVARALRFEGITLPLAPALAQIARPHDFKGEGHVHF